jgi:hypothetical protein
VTTTEPSAVEQIPFALDQPSPGRRTGRPRGGTRAQTLLGATGTGKTFTMANVIERYQRPTLVLRPTARSPRSWRRSSASSSRTTRSSTSSPTTTTTSPRRTSRAATPTSPRTRTSTTRSTSCATPPRGALRAARRDHRRLGRASTASASRASTSRSSRDLWRGRHVNRSRWCASWSTCSTRATT